MKLKNNKHLKEVEKVLNDWDSKKGYLTTNDINGVDLISPIDIKKLGFKNKDEDEIADLLELHYDGSDFYFRKSKDDYHPFALVLSTCEEIFVTYDGELCFPDKDTKSIKLSKENRELEILAYSLQWMHKSGCFPGIYELDYYSNSPTSISFYDCEEYKKLSTDDKKQAEEVDALVNLCEFIRRLEDNTTCIGELPSKFYETLPQVLQHNDGYLEVIKVGNFDSYTLTLDFNVESELEAEDIEELQNLTKKGILTEHTNGITFTITINLLPNSVRFMKGLDDMLGLSMEVA